MDYTDLTNGFSKDLFLAINNQLIESDFTPDSRTINKPNNSNLIVSVENIGSYDELDLQVFTVKHTSASDARIGISKELFKLMKDYSFRNALIASYSDDQPYWRYSLITSDLNIDAKGRITKEFSNPKRFSFLLGENQKVNTPYKQLLKLGR